MMAGFLDLLFRKKQLQYSLEESEAQERAHGGDRKK